jgi:hypothetical protein
VAQSTRRRAILAQTTRSGGIGIPLQSRKLTGLCASPPRPLDESRSLAAAALHGRTLPGPVIPTHPGRAFSRADLPRTGNRPDYDCRHERPDRHPTSEAGPQAYLGTGRGLVSPLVAASEPKGQGPRVEEGSLGPRPSPLFRYRYAREDSIKLLRFIDWLIRLPPPLELALRQELAELEEQTKMSYVTSWEQFAREEGSSRATRRARPMPCFDSWR